MRHWFTQPRKPGLCRPHIYSWSKLFRGEYFSESGKRNLFLTGAFTGSLAVGTVLHSRSFRIRNVGEHYVRRIFHDVNWRYETSGDDKGDYGRSRSARTKCAELNPLDLLRAVHTMNSRIFWQRKFSYLPYSLITYLWERVRLLGRMNVLFMLHLACRTSNMREVWVRSLRKTGVERQSRNRL